ncbi:hypothetical protein A2Z00_03145 [Candidatus Gottesmanbacteria bacterium RBG_13_45_10]|uniref:Uncharacterized protein n=1 Tax=Candidatus Gottesmanbacteria bacterium RBG_13_45_10 TaxID=1798370 RepID=A0A1F5ZH21_9BACT|nr:MAG: hypothetical protein A2Z00_03145 [Candidatus Gottesmanbacteria bacterium RBG_13_45_10]
MTKETSPVADQQQFYLNGFSRLIAGLKEDGDDAQIFEYLSQGLQTNPTLLLPIIEGSIEKARVALGQERRGGSSATLYYPIEAAIKYLAKQKGISLDSRGNPFNSNSWSFSEVMSFLQTYQQEIIDIAGAKTTAKNLPQRAKQMMWLIDQTTQMRPGSTFTFIELGASTGLILDAFRKPKKFREWYEKQPSSQSSQQVPFGVKLTRPEYAGIGLDISTPEMDWNLANILDVGIRDEVQDFITVFPARSRVIVADAQRIQDIPEVARLFAKNDPSVPVVISCFMLYQVLQPARDKLEQSVRDFLQAQGGGFFIKTDIAKYMGKPSMAGGALSWIENEKGDVISPTIVLGGKTISTWEVRQEDI